MAAWQWVITICLPILTLDHCGMTIWNILRRTDVEEIASMKKRDEEWQSIFKSIDESFRMNTRRLLDTWAAMKIFHDSTWKKYIETGPEPVEQKEK